MRKAAILAGLLALLAAAFWFKGGLVEPAAVPEKPGAGAFDTGRAIGRLRRLLGDEAPHPVDSPEADAVRGRLLSELRGLGLSPEVTDDFTCNSWRRGRGIACARVRNVLALMGPPGGRPVMMVSHYDSTPAGPGAGDDGIGMAVMLETAALLKERKLARPVLLLFNEGEEAGLIGARAFMERNPLASRVEAVVNLEARGVTGPAIMFETSRPNGNAVAAYARSTPSPSANSMTADFYERMPNDTDVTVFKERPYTILNFAIVGNETRYHSPGDDLAALDPKSVRHMGEQALAATLELANGPSRRPGGERLYADLLGLSLVSIPMAIGLAVLAGLVLLFAWLAWSRRGGVARAGGVVLLALADATLTVFIAQWFVGLFRDGEWWRGHPQMTALAVSVSALAAGIGALLVLARPIARDRLRIGHWLVFVVLGGLLCFLAPGAAIFFLAPPLVAGAAMLARRWERPAALLACGLLFLSWAPLLHLTETLMGMGAAWMFAPLAALIALPLLIELKPVMNRLPRGAIIGVATAASVLAWIAAAMAPAYSEDRKQAFGIDYVWDQAAGRAFWTVANDGAALPDGFKGFERAVRFGFSPRPRWAAPAPRQAVQAPTVERAGDRTLSAGRLLTLRIAMNGAEALTLRVPEAARLAVVRADGVARRMASGKGDATVRCVGRSCDGRIIELLLESRNPVELVVVGNRRGLPAAARPLVAARPRTAQPQYAPDGIIAFDRLRL